MTRYGSGFHIRVKSIDHNASGTLLMPQEDRVRVREQETGRERRRSWREHIIWSIASLSLPVSRKNMMPRAGSIAFK